MKLAKNDAELGRFSFCSSFGWTLGGLISFQVYLWLSSNEWCQYLFGRDKVLSTQVLVNFIGLSFILMSVGVYLTPEVKDAVELDDQGEDEEEKTSMRDRFSEIVHKLGQLRNKP